MLKFLVKIVLLFCFASCNAQQTFNHIVINRENNDPVAYTEVSTGSAFFIADVNGFLELIFLPSDTLSISRMGYISQRIPVSELRDTIKLEPFDIKLPEVNVSAAKFSIEIGFHKLNSIGWSGSAESGTARTLATFIKSDSLIGLIEHIFVRIKNQKKGTKYMLSIFEAGADSKPGKLIYETKYISDNNKNLLKINILEAGVEFSTKGVYVGVRVLGSVKGGGATLKLTKTNGAPVSYFLYKNIWFVNDNLNPEYNLTYQIGLEVIPYN